MQILCTITHLYLVQCNLRVSGLITDGSHLMLGRSPRIKMQAYPIFRSLVLINKSLQKYRVDGKNSIDHC